ncbi:hypothetical protein GPECTOR_6g522 [Gonium pectorale]|uniref:Uncharacterized protein n=1 Tax=Gonium pectorale TaxID=33097 RepID=A0A150GUQ9_GONPE|nr:hypothetical protein GPECTOR_6g522 [Gonium pectorale]|eukprot:KXZ53605.1 hypothetical protein GPECTOR_6g522 [Gonium pectorale]
MPGGQEAAACQVGLPWAVAQTRELFGAAKPKPPNPQIHTHDKYKRTNPQPTHEWMLGRFVMDRNGAVWHRQANYRHHRHSKRASRLTRLKRWKPLAAAYAAKFRKIGFREKYWAAALPEEVPGSHDAGPGRRRTQPARPPPRRSAVPKLDQTWGDPALRQSWKPPPRPRIQ